MLRGYRGVVAALAGIASLCGLVGVGLVEQSRYQQEAYASASKYAARAANEVQQACVIVGTWTQKADCQRKAVAEYRLKADDNRRDYADLVAQQTSALWTSIMGIAALIGMALSVVGVILVWTTFNATKAANGIAQRAFEYQVRPWIKIAVELGQIVFSGDDISIKIKTVSTNVGQSPANRLSMVALILDGRWESDRVFNRMPTFFDDTFDERQERCVFPNEHWQRSIVSECSNIVGEREKACLVVVAQYSSPATSFKKFHYTARIYDFYNIKTGDTTVDFKDGPSFIHIKERDSFPSYGE